MSINKFTPPTNRNWGHLGFIKNLVLMVVMIVTTSNTYGQAHFEVIDGLRYLIDENANTATLVANPDEKYAGVIVIPEKVTSKNEKECLVTALSDNCFNSSNITSITIPPSVTSLGDGCFSSCSYLTNITISSITSLGDNCFSFCSDLTSITIPSSVTSLGKFCFSFCKSLTSITIPFSVISLGGGCFQDCTSLTSITIPSSIASIDTFCFYDCNKLETIYFKGSRPNDLINSSIPTTCIFYVPKEYLQDYKDAIGSKYSYIFAWNSGEDSPTDKCMVPTITYAEGKLRFASSTKGAEYHYTITHSDIAKDSYSQDGEVALSATCSISAYATADGYQPSDKATATLYWIDAKIENEPSANINTVKTRGIIASSN